jgi:hypothetical protein
VSRRRSSRRLKVVLAGLVLAGSMSFLTVSGTYAIFTSEERDAGGTAASGTLTLSEVTNGVTATPCKSWSTGATLNANTGCALLISTPTLQVPGQSVSGTVALQNTGSVDANDLRVYMPTCTTTTSPSAGVVGGGNPCTEITDNGNPDGLELTIEASNSLQGEEALFGLTWHLST